jgi:uncharacterized transporter YbjL
MTKATGQEKLAASTPVNKSSLWRTLLAVLWAFVGLRKGSEFEKDIARVTPFHLVGVGLVVCLVFVVSLMFFVKWVVAH